MAPRMARTSRMLPAGTAARKLLAGKWRSIIRSNRFRTSVLREHSPQCLDTLVRTCCPHLNHSQKSAAAINYNQKCHTLLCRKKNPMPNPATHDQAFLYVASAQDFLIGLLMHTLHTLARDFPRNGPYTAIFSLKQLQDGPYVRYPTHPAEAPMEK